MISKRLKELRQELGLTQSELAERLGVSLGAVKHWEQGKGEPNGATLAAMSYLFETSVDYLLGCSDVRTIARSDAERARLLGVVENLSPSAYDALMKYAEFLADMERNGGERHV